MPSYAQRRTDVRAGAVLWRRQVVDGPVAVLPDGCMDLLWLDGRLLVAGPDTRVHHSTGTATTVYGIRFAPGTAPALLGVRAEELRDRRAEVSEVWHGPQARAMTELVAGAPDPARGLEEVARRCARSAAPPDPLSAQVVRRLRAGDSVAATAAALGLGTRRLHRLSVAAFGYGPKTLARILRMEYALDLARAGTGWADVAATAGYVDQSHLVREIRALAGRPPGAVLDPHGPAGDTADRGPNAG